MRTRSLVVVAGAVAATLCLGGCSSSLDRLQDGLEDVIEHLQDIDIGDSGDHDSDDGADEAKEASMPSGFPAGLPLPDGKLVQAMREGENFVFAHERSSDTSIESMVRWFTDEGWELVDDLEIPPMRTWSFGGPETNDHGHRRTVTFGYNTEDSSSTYALDVRED